MSGEAGVVLEFFTQCLVIQPSIECNTLSQVDWFLLHQANARIIDSIRANFSCDKEKFPLNLDKYGNTSSASIPILLDELVRTNKIKSGDNLVLSAFGAGFVSGACVLQWN